MNTYEKKYKDALEKAKSMIDDLRKGEDILAVSNLESMFPELKESEDERMIKFIKKQLFNIKKTITENYELDAKLTKAIDWLEKQGEKPADKVKPKFKVGDFIVNDYCMGKVIELTNDAYLLDTEQGIPFSCEHNAHLWTIQDAKVGDVLFSDLMDGKTFIYNGVNSDMAILYSFIISNDGKDVLPYHIGKPNTGIGNIEENKNIIHPATKEQRDLLFQKMKEAGYMWDEEKKELRKIEQKSADKTEPNFKVGDWITNGHATYQITFIDSRYWYSETRVLGNVIDIDKKYYLWTIQDAKDGDVLVYNNSSVEIILLFKKWMNGVGDGAYSYAHTFNNEILFNNWSDCGYTAHPATKKQRDHLFEKIHKAGYEWDVENNLLKSNLTEFEDAVEDMMNAYRDAIGANDVTIEEVKKHAAYLLSLIPYKSAKWSEDDDAYKLFAISAVEDYYDEKNSLRKDLVDWLKSIKQRIEK